MAPLDSVGVLGATVGTIAGVQLLGFIPAAIWQTERYYDLVASMSFIAALIVSTTLGGKLGDDRQIVANAMVLLWTLRLGSFLFSRINADGGVDTRMTPLKKNLFVWMFVWLLNGLWALLTSLPVYALNAVPASQGVRTLDAVDCLLVLLYAAGLVIQSVADYEKREWRRHAANEGRWIQQGIWAFSQHPNYFGEMVLHCSIGVFACRGLDGAWWVVLVGPVLEVLLLSFVSGIPLLRRSARRKWGDQAAWQHYFNHTSVLLPWFPAPVLEGARAPLRGSAPAHADAAETAAEDE